MEASDTIFSLQRIQPHIPATVILVGILSISPLRAQDENLTDAGSTPQELNSPQTETSAVTSPSERPYWRQNLFGRFFRDQKFLFTEWWPSEFRRPGFTLPLLAGVGLASTSNRTNGEGPDLELEQYVQSENGARGVSWARALSDLGDATSGAALIGTGYLIGRWSHHDQLAEASSLSAEALISAGLYSTVLKGISSRHRPGDVENGEFFDYHHTTGSVDSFPSGHATGAFSVATVFAGVYSDRKWVSWFAYSTAGLIGASRVALGRHFPSDILAGAMIGNSIGRMVLARQQESRDSTSSFHPLVDSSQRITGFIWTYRW